MANGAIELDASAKTDEVVEVEARASSQNLNIEVKALLQKLDIEGEIDGNKLKYGPTKLYDYEKLTNKPQIEGVTLIGNKQLSDLGLKEISNQNIEDILSKVFEED